MQTASENFIIDRSGVLRYSHNKQYIISGKSRVSWFGCYLYLTEVEHHHKACSIFIYRDSLTSLEFSRLKRIVYFVQKHGGQKFQEQLLGS